MRQRVKERDRRLQREFKRLRETDSYRDLQRLTDSYRERERQFLC